MYIFDSNYILRYELKNAIFIVWLLESDYVIHVTSCILLISFVPVITVTNNRALIRSMKCPTFYLKCVSKNWQTCLNRRWLDVYCTMIFVPRRIFETDDSTVREKYPPRLRKLDRHYIADNDCDIRRHRVQIPLSCPDAYARER